MSREVLPWYCNSVLKMFLQARGDNSLTEQSVWNLVADSYQDLTAKCTMHGTNRLIEIMKEKQPFTEDSDVLDVGAGTGVLTLSVKGTNADTRVLATDISTGMLAQIDKFALPGVQTQREDAVTLAGIPNNTFTHGMSSFCIQFTPDPHACVRSLYRVIRPGGYVGIVIWGPITDPKIIHDRACCWYDSEYVPVLPTVKNAWDNEKQHKTQLEDAGFVDVGTEFMRQPFGPGDPDSLCDYWFRGSNPIPAKLVGDWVEHGGTKEQLEREFRKILKEDYSNGKNVYMDAVLGWGRKPIN